MKYRGLEFDRSRPAVIEFPACLLSLLGSPPILEYYVDGSLDGQATGSTPATASIPIAIGAERYLGVLYAVMSGAIDEVGIWSRALSAGEVSLLHANGFGGLFSSQFPLAEPLASNRYLWRGKSLAGGFARSGQTNGSSVFYVFGDDANGNNRLDAGDDFVTAEYFVAATNATLLTLSRQPLATAAVAQSYGLASVNFLNRSNEVFFTGEPDGQVFAWTATGTNPLQRQLFSAQHAGKPWHALTGVKTLEPGEGLAGLLVDPATPNKCYVIFWPPQRELPQSPNFPQTAPLARVLPNPAAGGNLASIRVRIWDAEGNASLPFLQFSPDRTNWWDVTNILFVDSLPYSLTTRVTASPTGSEHTFWWKAGTEGFASGITNIFVRARARDISLLVIGQSRCSINSPYRWIRIMTACRTIGR